MIIPTEHEHDYLPTPDGRYLYCRVCADFVTLPTPSSWPRYTPYPSHPLPYPIDPYTYHTYPIHPITVWSDDGTNES